MHASIHRLSGLYRAELRGPVTITYFYSLLGFWGTEADWIRRTGVLIAIAGTAVAAPDGTAHIWRILMSLGRRGWDIVRTPLARVLPWLKQSQPAATAPSAAGSITAAGTVGVVLTMWSENTPDTSKFDLIRQNLTRIVEH